jgi:D-tyrosyl-tRNA(Tyr) deacylase
MRAVIQRVLQASVSVDDRIVGEIAEPGLLVLLGVTHSDTASDAEGLAAKIWGLRILREEKSASDVCAPLLVVSQFTVYGDSRKGRRPTWNAAAPTSVSEPLYEEFCSALEGLGATVARGAFGEDMRVSLINDGPVTLIVEAGG